MEEPWSDTYRAHVVAAAIRLTLAEGDLSVRQLAAILGLSNHGLGNYLNLTAVPSDRLAFLLLAQLAEVRGQLRVLRTLFSVEA